jgi:chromosome partitioning protein
VRVPFRSREQKRGRHSPDDSGANAYSGAQNGNDHLVLGADDDHETDIVITPVDRSMGADEVLETPEDPPPDEGSALNVTTAPVLDEPPEVSALRDTARESRASEAVSAGNSASGLTAPEESRKVHADGDRKSSNHVAAKHAANEHTANERAATERAAVVTLEDEEETEALPDSVSGYDDSEVGALEDATPDTDAEPVPVEEAKRERPKLPRVIAVANQKGGVGKTTTAVNLGAGLAEIGFRVLVIDLDPQGNATTGLGIDARNFEVSMYDVIMKDVPLDDCIEPTSLRNLFVAPATIDLAGAEIELVPSFSREFKLRKAIATVVDDFDYVLIDCPPSLGLITINGLAAASEVLVPIQCEYYALEGLSQLLRNVQLVQSNLNETLEVSTIVLTMYDARTKLADQVASEVRTHFGPRVCRIMIPRTVRISEAPSFGQPITVFDPTSRGAIAYRELAKEVSGGET